MRSSFINMLLLSVLPISPAWAEEKAQSGADISPFGIGSCYTNNRSAKDNARWAPRMASIGIHFMRTGHTEWNAIEPAEGKWTWDALDGQMTYLESQHFQCGALLSGNAKWNRLDRPGTLPVNNLTAWSRYVTELCRHLKGRVKFFEVWNEPPNGTGPDQTPGDYAKVLITAFDAAHAVDRDCKVGLAAKSVHVNYLEQVIKAGAKDHFDYVVLHPYEVLNGIADDVGTEPVYLHIVPTVRKMLVAQNPAKADVPIIFTELGCDAGKGLDVQANALVKAYTMGIAQGVACIEWFEAMDGDSGPMGLLDGKGTPRASYPAMARLIEQLGQHPQYLGWVLLNGKDYGFLFQGARGIVLSAWAAKGPPDHVDFGTPVQAINAVTGQTLTRPELDLTSVPMLVGAVPESLVAQAKANRSKSVPWGGDYADAKSVSISMGKQNKEDGLHTLSGNAVAEAVIAYGGSARSGDVPGGNMFVVDPEFLSYATAPIRITAVVRRNAANVPAGFNLNYESTHGFKHAGGWYSIPGDGQWHTVDWHIEDPEFVNYWGFNFSLDSDGNRFNKYLIQRVTVTRLDR